MPKVQRFSRSGTPASRGDLPRELAGAASLGPGAFSQHHVKAAVPRTWEERARRAVEYYQEEPLVSNAINAWRTFALGDEIGINAEDDGLQADAMATYWRLNLNRFVKDMVLQLLIKGDAIGYMVPSDDGADIERVICVNPLSVSLVYEDDRLIGAVQRPRTADGSLGEEIPLDLDKLIHLKWNVPDFESRGQSMILPAFEAIELLRDYRRAERAIAKRWATPLRFIQVGGAYGSRLITPDQRMLEKIRDELQHMDLESGMVVPFYIKAETYGSDGAALNTEAKVKELKEDILVALGMARSIVMGDGPNFATASVSMQKMVVQLKEIKQAAKDLLDWVFDAWLELRGKGDELLHYQFSDLDLNAEVDQKKLLLDLHDRGLISKTTLQKKMGLAPEVETKAQEKEDILVDTNWSVEDISRLVALEVLTVDEARDKLGLSKPAAQAFHEAAINDANRLYQRHPFPAGAKPEA